MYRAIYILLILLAFMVYGCGEGSEDNNSNNIDVSGDYVVFAWNDLGMHCLNPTYDTAVILPPYNNLWVQVIKRGSKPQIVTQGVTVEYKLINNTYSYGKASFGQFWDNSKKLFGIDLEHDKGLNLDDPSIHNGLSGQMVSKADHFVANGIPATPVDDSNVSNAYQVAEVTVKDSSGNTIAQTRATIPVSDEINCARCHGDNAFQDILQKHDQLHKTSLVSQKPVLCASCHGSPALGMGDKGSAGTYLSQAIHGSHASKGADCLDCHPGKVTKCSRSIAHTSEDGNCKTCHGDMANVANSIKSGRIPWVSEPKCATCHQNIAEIETGTTLYRNAKGHGLLYCPSCHGSPHAMAPSRENSDNYQAIQYQGEAKSIGSCGACHSNSKGENDSEEFAEVHGGTNYEHESSCHICHTSLTSDTSKWPHAYQWKAR